MLVGRDQLERGPQVVAGSVLTWLQTAGQSRKVEAAARDEQFTVISSEAADLINQVRMRQSQTQVYVRVGVGAKLLESERQIVANSARLSMNDSIPLKQAIRRVSDAVRDYIEHVDRGGYQEREDELQAALTQLRNARDLAATQWWQITKRRYFNAELRRDPLLLRPASGSDSDSS